VAIAVTAAATLIEQIQRRHLSILQVFITTSLVPELAALDEH
jgi:hypothetical protein